MEQHGIERREELVDRFAGALPVAVVIDDEDAARAQSRPQMLQLVSSGLVPVGVKPQDADLLGRNGRNGVLDHALDKPDAISGIPSRREVCPDLVERRNGARLLAGHVGSREYGGGVLSRNRPIDLFGRRHPLESVI